MPIKMAPQRLQAASGSRLGLQEGRTNKQADPFYLTPEWRAFRNLLIKERGWRCEDKQCKTPRGPWKQIYGDHIIELADGGERLSRANVMLRCGGCHGRKTIEQRARRAGLVDIFHTGGGG